MVQSILILAGIGSLLIAAPALANGVTQPDRKAGYTTMCAETLQKHGHFNKNAVVMKGDRILLLPTTAKDDLEVLTPQGQFKIQEIDQGKKMTCDRWEKDRTGATWLASQLEASLTENGPNGRASSTLIAKMEKPGFSTFSESDAQAAGGHI